MKSSSSIGRVSVVIPTFRSAEWLERLVDELDEALTADDRVDDHELILVNDASPDNTWATLEHLAQSRPRLRGVNLLGNHGQPLATMAGMTLATGDVVVTMDDDLQHPPSEISVLLSALEANPSWDAVVGTWPRDKGFVRGFGSWLYAFADRVSWGTPKNFRHTAFRAMRRPAVDAVVNHGTVTPVIGPILYNVAAEVHNVEIAQAPRAHGSSGFKITDGIRRLVHNFTAGSTLPLRLLAMFGFASMTIAALLSFYYLFIWASDGRGTQGWLSVFLLLLFIGGSNLLAAGILGQYIGMIVREVRRPPQWSIREQLNAPPAHAPISQATPIAQPTATPPVVRSAERN